MPQKSNNFHSTLVTTEYGNRTNKHMEALDPEIHMSRIFFKCYEGGRNMLIRYPKNQFHINT